MDCLGCGLGLRLEEMLLGPAAIVSIELAESIAAIHEVGEERESVFLQRPNRDLLSGLVLDSPLFVTGWGEKRERERRRCGRVILPLSFVVVPSRS